MQITFITNYPHTSNKAVNIIFEEITFNVIALLSITDCLFNSILQVN